MARECESPQTLKVGKYTFLDIHSCSVLSQTEVSILYEFVLYKFIVYGFILYVVILYEFILHVVILYGFILYAYVIQINRSKIFFK